MADEPSLPALPPFAWDASTQSFQTSKKRSRKNKAPPVFSQSSDPAVFSSDDDPAIDNYVQGRRKKRYVGPWYAQHPASGDSSFEDDPQLVHRPAPKPRRMLERQLDSGVWMGSDGTDMDESGIEHLPLPTTRPNIPQLQPRARRTFGRVASLRVSAAEALARNRIRECIEEGDERVDLSAIGLETLSNATIEPLSEFACIPLVTKGVAFEQSTPSLKLFLGSNALTRLPRAIFQLEHLTVLSLRGNGLQEVPPGIGQLPNLKVLNLSQNALNHLSYELAELLMNSKNISELYLHPNPFWQPESLTQTAEAAISEANESEMLQRFEGHRFRGGMASRSPVQLSYSNGVVHSSFRLAPIPPDSRIVPTEKGLYGDSEADTQPRVSTQIKDTSSSRVPTLFELALRTCYQTSQLEQLPDMLPMDSPPHLRELLFKAMSQREMGGLACTVCRRPMVVPRTAWIEWWHLCHSSSIPNDVGGFSLTPLSHNADERLVPFLRRGCSWKCIPDEYVKGTLVKPIEVAAEV